MRPNNAVKGINIIGPMKINTYALSMDRIGPLLTILQAKNDESRNILVHSTCNDQGGVCDKFRLI